MTESADDTQRPVSVAELLARNGASDGKISGHRRRLRGNADAIPVAELTGEIPVIRDRKTGRGRPNGALPPIAPAPPVEPTPAPDRPYLRSTEPALFGGDSIADEAVRRGPGKDVPSSVAPSSIRSIFPPTPTPKVRPGEPRKSIDFDDATGVIAPVVAKAVRPSQAATPPAAPEAPRAAAPAPAPEPAPTVEPLVQAATVVAAPDESSVERIEPVEHVVPEPAPESVEEEHDDSSAHEAAPDVDHDPHTPDVEIDEDDVVDEVDDFDHRDFEQDESAELPLAATGHYEADEDTDEDLDSAESEPATADDHSRLKTYAHGTWVAIQYLVAAAIGAALFKGFDELWRWNPGIALVLGVLLIAVFVASLWVIRKTVDLVSILIAIVVGTLIAFGPLVLLLTSTS